MTLQLPTGGSAMSTRLSSASSRKMGIDHDGRWGRNKDFNTEEVRRATEGHGAARIASLAACTTISGKEVKYPPWPPVALVLPPC
jgi:hypothetical protein